MKQRRILASVLLALVGFSLVRLFWEFKPFGVLQDDACYVRNALGWLGLMPPEESRVHSVGPSLMVLPYLVVFGHDLTGIRIVPTFFSVAWVVMFYFCASQMVGGRVSGLVALCVFTSPGFLLNAPNVLGEPLLNFWIWCAISLGLFTSGTRREIGLWICGLSACFSRSEGLALPLAIIAWHVFEGRRKQAVVQATSVGLGLFLVNAIFIERGPKYHQLELTAYFQALPDLATYPLLWINQLLSVIGLTYVGGLPPEWPSKALYISIALLLVLLTIVGWVRLRNQKLGSLVQIISLCIFCALLAWPYMEPRHALALWPMIVLCAALALPERGRVPALSALALMLSCVAIPNLLEGQRTREPLNAGFLQTIDFLKSSTPEEAVLMSKLGCTYSLLTQRRVVTLPADSSYPELLETLHKSGSVYLVLEQINATLTDVRGLSSSLEGQHFRRWLDHSSYFSRVVSNSAQAVYLFTPQPGFQEAFSLWSQSMVGNLSVAQRRDLMQRAIVKGNDLPFIFASLAELELTEGRLEPARSHLEQVLKQYPFDLTSLYNLALVTAQLGEHERALGFATFGRQIAQDMGDQAMIQMFEALLSGSGDSVAK